MPDIRILIVEDEILVARDLEQLLADLGYRVAGATARGDEAVRLAAALRPDLVLMDIHLQGQLDGIAAAAEIREGCGLPVVFLTAHADATTISRAKLTNPVGYVLKPFEIRELSLVIEIALYKHKAECELRQSERRYATTLSSIGDAVIATNERGAITFMNPVAERLTGWLLADARGLPLGQIFSIVNENTRQPVENPTDRVLSEGIVMGLANSTILLCRDGRELPIDDCASPIKDDGGVLTGAVLVFRDITAKRMLEKKLLQTQKLESLGVMAGGIAHDFNNLLTTVLGYADLALQELPANSPACPLIGESIEGARRAAELTSQMLAYSGKGHFVVEPVDLSRLTSDMTRLLEISISKQCTLTLDLSPHLPAVEADASQLRQVIMNLIINASEAIADVRGVITVRTGVRHCRCDERSRAILEEKLPEGDYVFLEVADTGSGMSEETKEKIFDPFFSTKFTGRGLGLAAVQGIVRGHHGAIAVSSELGKGTTFQILLPATSDSVRPDHVAQMGARAWRGSGTVLIVDDEEAVRGLARCRFEAMGFSVLTAADGRQGVDVFRRDGERIRLVLLDLTMPHLDGAETYRELKQIRGDVRVILSSGNSEESARSRLVDADSIVFIQKPYRYQDLVAVVRKALGHTEAGRNRQAASGKEGLRRYNGAHGDTT